MAAPGAGFGRSRTILKRGERRESVSPLLFYKIIIHSAGPGGSFPREMPAPGGGLYYEKSSAGSSSAVQKVSLDHAVGRADRAAVFMEGDKEQADPLVQAVEIFFGLLQEDSPVHRILQNARVHDHELGI